MIRFENVPIYQYTNACVVKIQVSSSIGKWVQLHLVKEKFALKLLFFRAFIGFAKMHLLQFAYLHICTLAHSVLRPRRIYIIPLSPIRRSVYRYIGTFSLLLFLFPISLFSQGLELSKAMGYLRNAQYDEAIPVFKSILMQDPANQEALKGLARSFYKNGNFLEATDWFMRQEGKDNPEQRFLLAKSYLFSRKYSDAALVFQQLITQEPQNPKWNSWLRICDSLVGKTTQHSGKPAISVLTVNNHDNSGGATVYQGDKLLFSSRAGKEVSLVYSPMKREGQFIDFYAIHLLSKPVPGKAECYAAIEAVSGKVWFTRIASTADSIPSVLEGASSGIFSGFPEETIWRDETAFGFNSSSYNVRHPAPAVDGSFVIFASDMPGGLGGYDLWMSRNTGGWQPPINLGPEINSPGNEITPVLSEDQQTLYFASDGHPGMGMLDLFSVSRKEGKWKMRNHLDFPINSAFNEHSYYPYGQGAEGFFSSDRPGGYGGEDIFLFEYTAEKSNCNLQESKKICVTLSETETVSGEGSENTYSWDTGDGFDSGGTTLMPSPARFRTGARSQDTGKSSATGCGP